jgi:hypothetical protein
MTMRLKMTFAIIALLAAVIGSSACNNKAGSSAKKPSNSTHLQAGSKSVEQAVAPERNPTGDIPDSQVFVKYASSKGGYELDVPEGWARTTNGMDAAFTYKFDGLSVKVTNAAGPRNVESVRKNQAELL